jgi:hypothetical protein
LPPNEAPHEIVADGMHKYSPETGRAGSRRLFDLTLHLYLLRRNAVFAGDYPSEAMISR